MITLSLTIALAIGSYSSLISFDRLSEIVTTLPARVIRTASHEPGRNRDEDEKPEGSASPPDNQAPNGQGKGGHNKPEQK